MTYQVLARKWRPQKFNEIVGQEHVSQSLKHALQHDRLHHAYLFTGTRGVGKTTIARILAKAINCENLDDFNPCGQCETCQAFDQGRFMDLIEVDAASRTKVEDTRDLLDNVQYAPNQGRYKVYLIDEVHMLSAHSFNALLKTLEEPPPHVKFLLATTDPQKIPVTILSRCLQFNLKRLLPAQIEQQMQYILQQEQIDFEENALKLLSRAADGSMRDGLSLLDQAIVYASGQVLYESVKQMLGTVASHSVAELIRELAAGNGQQLLDKVAELADLTPDFNDTLQQLIRMLHRIALNQQIPGLNEYEFDPQEIVELSTLLSPEDVQLFYQIALTGQKDLDLAPDQRSGFEMVLLRMLAFKPVDSVAGQSRQIPDQMKNTISESPSFSADKPIEKNNESDSASSVDNDWEAIIQNLAIRGLTKELASHCVLGKVDDTRCELMIAASHQNLLGGKPEEKLQKALQDYYGRPLKLKILIEENTSMTPAMQRQNQLQQQQDEAVAAIEQDANVNALKEKFNARVMPDTIEPIK